jgi:hypothetical protein
VADERISSVARERPEDELLLRCARVCRNPEGAARMAALFREEMDWAYLLEAARRHATILKDWALRSLPASLFLLHRVLRPIRLTMTKKYGRKPLRHGP